MKILLPLLILMLGTMLYWLIGFAFTWDIYWFSSILEASQSEQLQDLSLYGIIQGITVLIYTPLLIKTYI